MLVVRIHLLLSVARNSVVFSDFKTEVSKYLINRANVRLISRFCIFMNFIIKFCQ